MYHWIGLLLISAVAVAGGSVLVYQLIYTPSQTAEDRQNARRGESNQSRRENNTNLPNGQSSKSYENANEDNNCLTTNNLSEILDKLWEARSKWYDIGIQLRLTVGDLDSIKDRNCNKPDECFSAMLIMRLRKLPGISWDDLLCALSHKCVGCCSVAEAVRRQLDISSESSQNDNSVFNNGEQQATSKPTGFKCPWCGVCSFEQYLGGKCPRSNSAFPYLDSNNLTPNEKEVLQTKLHSEAKIMIKEFSDLVLEMRRSFTKRKIDPRDIAASIHTIAPLEASTRSLTYSASTIIGEMDCIHTIISGLVEHNYLSFFNYHIVEYLITNYGTQNDKDMLQDYKVKFKTFCQRSVFEVPKDVFGPNPRDSETIAFKVTNDVLTCLQSSISKGDTSTPSSPTLKQSSKTLHLSLEDAQQVQETIANELGLKSICNLVFLNASRGCTQLTFSVPRVAMNRVKPLLSSTSCERSPTTSTNPILIANLEKSGIHLLCGPPGKPHTLVNDGTEVGTIHLIWGKPEYQGFHQIQHYCIHYRSMSDSPEQWKTLQTAECREDLEIKELSQTDAPFVFKVQAVSSIGTGIESKLSDPIDLPCNQESSLIEDQNRDTSKPGKPRALVVTDSMIELEWTKPVQGAHSITAYTIFYRSANDPPDQWKNLGIKSTSEKVIVSPLTENTEYYFRICPEYMGGMALDLQSDVSGPIATKARQK